MFSYSKVSCFETCPYKFKLKYIDKLETLPNMDADNPLFIGTACHTGIEKRSINEAIENYKSNYKFTSFLNDLEIVKLEEVLKKAIVEIPDGEYERCIKDGDEFVGYIDCLVPVEDGVFDLLDFKYSNNVSKYKKSPQIHIYKYYFEKLTGNKIRDMYYVFMPKYSEKVDYTAPMDLLVNNIKDFYKDQNIRFEKIEYKQEKVDDFFKSVENMKAATEFLKTPNHLCSWCDYFKYCSSNGKNTTELKASQEDDLFG